jgi:hypothetical protein
MIEILDGPGWSFRIKPKTIDFKNLAIIEKTKDRLECEI